MLRTLPPPRPTSVPKAMTGLREPRARGVGVRRPGRRGPRTVALLAAWLAPIAATIVATPYVLDRIGPDEFGLVTVVLGLVVSMAAVGMARPLAVGVAADGAEDARRASLWGVALAVIGTVGVAVLAAAIPLDWLVGDDIDEGHARAAVLAGAFAVLGTALMATATGKVIGVSRFVAVGTITAIAGVSTSIGYVLLASFGGGAVALILWNGAVTCSAASILLIAGRHRAAEPNAGLPAGGDDVSAVPSMWPFIVVQVAGNLAILVERLGLAATTDLATVTAFVIPHTMVLTLHAGLVWLTAPLLTDAVRLLRRGDQAGLVAAYRSASRVAAAIAVFGGVTLAIVGHTLLDRWLGGESVLALGPFLLLVAYTVGLSLTVVPWNIADATGEARENARVGLLWLGVVIVGAVATRRFGVEATVAARAALLLSLPVYVRRVERRSLGGESAWSVPWLARLSCVGGAVALTEWLLWVALGRGLPGALVAVLAGALLFAPLAGLADVRNLRRWRAEPV